MSYRTADTDASPPGPRGPGLVLGLGWLLAEPRLFPRWHARYGDVFMLPATGFGVPLVVVADPALAREIFAGDMASLRAGDANSGPLRELVGEQSLLLLDGEPHLHRRRLMLPPFHGDRMRVYGELMSELTDAEINRWPLQRMFPLRPALQAITLRIILRAVFGIERDARAVEHLEKLFIRYSNQGMRPWMLRYAPKAVPIGEYLAPADSLIAISISLIHRRADLYPEPGAFRPERFEDGQTESFAWLPFGGGPRRCLGAAFATYEMRIVLRRIVERCELQAADSRPERPRRRAVTNAPHRGTRVLLRRRTPVSPATKATRLGSGSERKAA